MNIFLKRGSFPSHFLKAVEEADIIDSFAYASIEEWRRETPGQVVDWTLKTRSPSTDDHVAYMRNVVQQLRDRSIEEVSNLPFVQRRLKQYREEEGRMIKIIQESSFFLEEDRQKEVIVIDLTSVSTEPPSDQKPGFSELSGSVGRIGDLQPAGAGSEEQPPGGFHVPFD